MYECLSRTYQGAAEREMLKLIPCADVIQKLWGIPPFVYGDGGMALCRDGYHMHYIMADMPFRHPVPSAAS